MSLISRKYKFIYVKPYKVAGSSTYQFFSKFCLPPYANDIDTTDPNLYKPIMSDYGIVGATQDGLEINGRRSAKSWGQHLDIKQVKENIGEEIFNSYFKFTSIRNPFTTALSLYFHREKFDGNEYGVDDVKSFNKWLKDVYEVHCETPYELTHNNYAPFNNWSEYYTIDGKVMCDFHIRCENLINDVNKVLKKLQIEEKISYDDFPQLRIKRQSYDLKKWYNGDKDYYNNLFKCYLEAFEYTPLK